MRAIMQNNSIAPIAEGAHPVQNHLQDAYAPPPPQPQPDVGAVGSYGEEIDADTAIGNVTPALGMGQETDDLREFYKNAGISIEPKKNNTLAGMKMTGIFQIMEKSLTQDQMNELTEKYKLTTKTKKFTVGGTINDFAKDFFRLKDMQ
jgi:hypothetical protein